jgi:acyl-coenzyme A synthetase/AMP-(fatty) acid ligase
MFGEVITYRARYQPDTPALETPQGPITYRRFESDINRMVGAIAALGLGAGSKVLVSDSRPYIHWLILFALERLGHVSVSDDAAGATIDVVSLDAIFAEGPSYAGRAPVVVQTSVEWLGPVLAQPEVAPIASIRRPDDPVRIITSSGTTGKPKAILLSRQALDNRVVHVTAVQIPTAARMLSTMGINSGGGFSLPLSVWLGGGTMIYGGALNAGQAIVQLRPTFLFMAPIQLQYALMQLPADAPRMPEMWIGLGGSAAPRRLCAEAARRLSDKLVFGYGSTEAGLTAIGPAHLVNGVPGAAGYRVPWADMQIVDDQYQPLPTGEIGHVRVRSDEMSDGYMDGDAISGAGSFLDGWFYPGDMGSIKEDGLFVLEGRSDDVLNIGGVKISAWTVEEKLMEEPGVSEAAACALEFGGVPHLAAAVVGDADPTALGRTFEAKAMLPIHIIAVDAIPRNQMGKIQRSELVSSLSA